MTARKLTAAALALAGVLALVAGLTCAPPPAAVAPVPIARLGLPPEAVEPFREFVASLPRLSVVGAAADADNQRRRIVLDSHLLRVGGGKWPFHGPQKTGDCAAFCIAGGIETDIAVQSETDPAIVWRPVDRCAIYGGGRVTIGRNAIRGEGLVPAWGLQWVDRFGILWADADGVPPYSGTRSDEWGRNGVPAPLVEAAKPHAGLTYARCDSAADVCNAIASGHPVPFGSMRFGTSQIKLTEGRNVAIDNEDWPHAQLVSGYDGTLASGQRLFRVVNSWGPNAHAPRSEMPGDHPGGYYVTWETMDGITREGMTFALSGSNGFRQREFVPDFSVIGAAAPPAALQEKSAMLPPAASLPLFVLGGLLLAAAVNVLLVGNARRRAAGLAALVALLAANVTTAQDCRPDWSTLTRAAQTTPPPEILGTGDQVPRWELLTLAAQREPKTTAEAVENVLPPPLPPPRVILDVYAPAWCSTCPQWKANLGDGDRDLRYRWHTADPPAEIQLQTRISPTFVRDGKLLTKDPAGMTHADFRRLVGLPAVRPSAVAAQN